MSERVVSGDADVLARAATTTREFDDSLAVIAGDLADALGRFRSAATEPTPVNGGAELTSLVRRWRATTDSLASQAIDFADADVSAAGPYTTHSPPRLTREDRALSVLLLRFAEFDTAGQGDPSKADDMVTHADLEIASFRDDEVGATARWILNQPDLLRFLDTGAHNIDYMDKVEEARFHATGGDGKISPQDVVAYIEKREVNRILRGVASKIDVSANGGQPDGVLSRADYESFVRSGQATDRQMLAIAVALRDGAVDGEQGVASDIAGAAALVATAKRVCLGRAGALTTMVMTASGVLAPVAAATGTAAGVLGLIEVAASAVEGVAGVIADEEGHVLAAGLGLATYGLGRATSVTIRGATTPAGVTIGGSAEEVLAGMLEGTVLSRHIADAAELAIGLGGNAAAGVIAEGSEE